MSIARRIKSRLRLDSGIAGKKRSLLKTPGNYGAPIRRYQILNHCQAGLRLSKNAEIPSTASSVSQRDTKARIV